MTTWEAAENWRSRGFRVFPMKPGTRKPAFEGYLEEATNDVGAVFSIWNTPRFHGSNIGVALGNGVHLLDIDVKNGKSGLSSFLLQGFEFDTLTVRTPSGGYHLYYSDPDDYSNRGGLWPGIDFKSLGGVGLAPGSVIDGKEYRIELDLPIAPLPPKLREALRPANAVNEAISFVSLDAPLNVQDAVFYLQNNAQISVQGMNGHDNAYKIAAMLTHEYALSGATALRVMLDHWNNRCLPPWEAHELETIVCNAAEYGRGNVGNKTTLHTFGSLVPVAAPAISPVPFSPPGVGVASTGLSDFGDFGDFGNYLPAAQRTPVRWVVRRLLAQGDINTGNFRRPGGHSMPVGNFQNAFCYG